MTKTLAKKIMRRVYYTYALRMITTPGVVQGFFMLSVLIGLTHFVSLGNVLSNMLHVEVGYLGTFLYNAVTNTEAWTLLLVGVFVFSALSLRFKIAPVRSEEVHAYAKI